MTSFVLVHGAMHGAWCWERVVPRLAGAPGVASVLAVDLPGHGAQRGAKALEAISLDDYVAHVVSEIERAGLEEVVLVGHSLAGLTLPGVAHRLAPRIRRVVYLATINPPAGCSVREMMAHPLSPLSRQVSLEASFCSDLDAETSEWLLSRLCEEPPGVLDQAVEVPRLPASLPSTYIVLEQDETLPPVFQREQAEAAGVDELCSFDSGHSAFAARPEELAATLLRYA